MNANFWRTALVALLLSAAVPAPAWALDVRQPGGITPELGRQMLRSPTPLPADTSDNPLQLQITQTLGGQMLSSPELCQFDDAPDSPLQLQEAIARALCNQPKTRETWANVRAQAAAVGVARAAYLPTISGNWQGARNDVITNVPSQPALSSEKLATTQTSSVSLNWTLYDFGTRGAALANASALLAASQAIQDATLQATFISVAKDYYSAQAATGALDAAKDVERMANDSFQAVQARVSKGVASISDTLQAQTAYEQAAISTIKAKGDLQITLGTLASDMNLSPVTPLTLPRVNAGVQPDAAFLESIDALIELARRTHPSVSAARAKLDAAIAKASQTQAQGLPSLGLVAKHSRNSQPASAGLGAPDYPATGREWYVGLQLTIPFFEGFGRTYQIRQAAAEVEQQRSTFDAAQQQVGLDVWIAYQSVISSTATLRRNAVLIDVARRAFLAAQHRYREGVGNILELLNAQSALAKAEQQHVQNLTDWRAARLRLAGSLGRLTFDDSHEK